ncbi:arylsulfatase [Sphingopyxis sp. RIFCSPHIGHO2_12_FULL_65_19]|uniref:arylsulfatase n=1 Tax=Sphingopyxis sp. RIFCSPHIGHO2_12_FULL_65_19 TaxID=1802172 RepID=UPI0008C4A87B|nr:arylsulfatase [Sphingopyxis sp. RIFCSPHIGHO2_12_FULL_65_19]OHD09287.1 MAG: arylsulfatase [Sphingopyxis sp. RIFCSPHIGHO2_12_FULL_65_19]
MPGRLGGSRRAAIILFGALVAAFPVQAQRAESATPRHPNIVILLADDWGFSDVGAFGSEIATPHIDALANAGMRFSNFHVAGSCSPTRAMLLTGVMNHRNGLGNMPETIPDEHRGKPGYDTVMNHRVVTMAELLKAAGYRTYLTGKWHLGSDRTRLPHARGFDRAFSLADAGADNFEQRPIEGLYDQANWTENGKPATLPRDYYSSRFVVQRMIDYIEADRDSGKPFLASVNFLANHIPVQAPDSDIARYSAMYRDGWTALRAARAKRAAAMGVMPAGAPLVTMPTTPDWASLTTDERAAAVRVMQAYGGMATAMDREVGRLVAHLKATGDYDNTIFVFLSDNGAEPTNPFQSLRNRLFLGLQYDLSTANIGRRGSFAAIGPGWASAASSPLSGYKFSATEGGLRVPLIIAWPGSARVRAGGISDGLAHVTDILPTLTDLAGVPGHGGDWRGRTVEPVTGRSLAPMLGGAAGSVHGDAPLGYELSGNAALFRGDYKLVRNLAPTGDGRWRLYDLKTDPGETRDLAAAMPDRFAAMMADYRAYAKANGVLDMPAGYTADEQINRYAFEQQGRKRLIRIGLWAGGIILLLAGLVWGFRRRRRRV